jgi:hypothetical protein
MVSKMKQEQLEQEINGVTIPGFILQLTLKKDKVTPEDKFILALLYYLPESPSNEFLTDRIRCGMERKAIRRHITKLIALGHIIDNGQKGKQRKLILNVTTKVKSRYHKKNLYIDPILMELLETCSQRMVAAIEFGFTRASEKWKRFKTGFSRRSYLYNKKLLIDSGKLIQINNIYMAQDEPILCHENEPILCHDECSLKYVNGAGLKQVFPSGVKNIGLELISKDINNKPLNDKLNQKYNPVMTSHLILADQMKEGLRSGDLNPMLNNFKSYKDTSKQETPFMTQSEITHLKNSKINTPVKSIKNKTIIKSRKNKPSIKATVEMSMIFQNYTQLTRHRIGSAAHLQSEKVIRGLKNGLCTEFSDYLNVIIEKGSNQKFKKSEIVLAFQKKFTLKERKSIYQKFNDLLSPEYWPKNKKNLPRCLWDALSHTNKYSSVSWLMYFILKDPKHLEKCSIVDMDYETEMIIRRWSPTPLKNSIPELKSALGMLNKYYYGEFLLPYYDRDTVIGGQWGTWNKYLNGYLNFLDERYPVGDKNPGWFKPHSRPVKSWEREMLRISAEIEKCTTIPPWTEEQTQKYQYA